MRKKIDFAQLFLYLFFFTASFFLYQVGNNGEPFSLALAYAMMGAGFSIPLSAIIGAFPSFFSGNLTLVFLYLGQAVLLSIGYAVMKKLHAHEPIKTGLFPMLFLSISLGLFVGIAPFQPYPLPFKELFALNSLTQKVIFAALIFLLSTLFYVALRALTRKLLKCRLRNDEGIFSLLFFLLVGVGICRFLSVNAYMGIAFFILLLFSCAVKDASALVCAFCLSLPPLFTVGLSPERFFLYGIAVSLFMPTGRLAAVFGLLAVYFGYGYFDGLYNYPASLLVQSLLSVLLPSLLFILLPSSWIREMENKLIFYKEKHLSRLAINRNRAAIGEKLFELSAVFREIQSTFHALNENTQDLGAKTHIKNRILEEVCARCPQRNACAKNKRSEGLDALIEVGCLKARASLIDIPRTLADVCLNQSDVLYSLNRQLTEYKTSMTEAENISSGRSLLAGQAQGISEILRNLALEQSEPLRIYTDKERALTVALLGAGIVCSEVLVYGDGEALTLSLVTYGNADVKKIAAVATHLFGENMTISEKVYLSNDKFCCILRKKPYFDAAFGVSTIKKAGATVSGDTHSVIKLDERKFLVALSDGMGSGEYARKISESTISLLESFYRAKMPSALVLSAVNKLMTFSKEESFACVDIAVVDLDSGNTDVVKIGSPLAFILSGNTVKVLETTSLPLGILDCLRPDASSYTLAENDVLLFLSDGIADAFGSTADLYEALRLCPTKNPQQLADALLESALNAYGGVAKDDMTVVAVRLFKNQAA